MKSNYEWKVLTYKIPKNSQELVEFLVDSRSGENGTFEKDVLHPGRFVERYSAFLADAKNAANEILNSIRKNIPIIIHGDYDVDGQTATAILWRTIFLDLNYKNVLPYIPNRFDEGYGLSEESLKGMENLLKEKGFEAEGSLVVTVDCGITAVKEVELAKEMGFKIIVSDHHHETTELPKPDYLVWTTKATGAGIAWVLSYLLLESNEKNTPHDINKYLDLAALGTICDLQPLLELNRAISKYGLERINKNPTLGIKTLKEISEIKTDIDTYHLGWILGPKLNATGRLESAMDALRMLCTEDSAQALIIGKGLDALNKTRQDKTVADYEHAYKQAESFAKDKKFLIAVSENYHEGVIGLVAGRLVQSFYKPAIAISVDKKTGLAKGSARSIEGVSIIEALNKFSELFEKSGGHEMAAGFTIKESNIEKLNEGLNSLNDWSEDVFTPKLKIDLEISPQLINQQTYEQIKTLSPFGPGNKEPIFLTRNFEVFNVSRFGKENQHLKLFLVDSTDKKHTSLIFNAPSYKQANVGDKIDAVYKLSLNEWNGSKNIELQVQDWKIT